MEVWVAFTFAAAFLQNARSLLQKRLTGVLSVNGAAYIRFLYAVPFAWAYALWLWQAQPAGFTAQALLYVAIASVAQIVATSCLLASFAAGNFAVGTAYSKTEIVQAGIVGLILLGDTLDLWVVAGITVSLVGVVLLSGRAHWREFLRPNRAMGFGLISGSVFAVSVVFFRAASIALDEGTYLQRAGLCVAMAVTLQTLLMSMYLRLREPGEIRRAMGVWRQAVWVGVTGMAASVGWFTAITLENAAVVRAVGQVELIFTVAASVWMLGERVRSREVCGMLLIVAGIVLLL